MSRVAPPPAWPIPAHVTATSPDADQQRAEQDRRARQTAELRAQYPDAQPWYGDRSGMWLAAPTGADRLVSAPTAAALAERLANHYRHMMSTPRTGGAGTAAPTSPPPPAAPAQVRAAVPSTRTPHRRGRHAARTGVMARLGLVT